MRGSVLMKSRDWGGLSRRRWQGAQGTRRVPANFYWGAQIPAKMRSKG